jgi:hypothetical protein
MVLLGLLIWSILSINNSKNKKASVMEYENSLPSKFYSKLKGSCCYDQKDFDRLTEYQKKKLLDHHGKDLVINN